MSWIEEPKVFTRQECAKLSKEYRQKIAVLKDQIDEMKEEYWKKAIKSPKEALPEPDVAITFHQKGGFYSFPGHYDDKRELFIHRPVTHEYRPEEIDYWQYFAGTSQPDAEEYAKTKDLLDSQN